MKFLNLFAIAAATASALRIRKQDAEHEMVQAIIDELDADNSGTISKQELFDWAKEQLDAACKEYDVPATQCAQYWEEGKKWLGEMFDKTDTSGDGEVDRKELDAALKGH